MRAAPAKAEALLRASTAHTDIGDRRWPMMSWSGFFGEISGAIGLSFSVMGSRNTGFVTFKRTVWTVALHVTPAIEKSSTYTPLNPAVSLSCVN